jgi:hypothetical protein
VRAEGKGQRAEVTLSFSSFLINYREGKGQKAEVTLSFSSFLLLIKGKGQKAEEPLLSPSYALCLLPSASCLLPYPCSKFGVMLSCSNSAQF